MDEGREPGVPDFSRDEGSGEAWEPDDEAGEAAWDDGSRELWDEADRVLADEQANGEESHTALPPKVEAWRKRSATGAILTGFAFGLQQVFEPKDEPAVVMETSGEPPKDLPVDADLEYGRPRHSVVNIRPWLLQGDQQQRDQLRGDQLRSDQQQAGDGNSDEDRDSGQHQDGTER